MLHRPLDVVVDDIDILPADDIAERVFYTVALKQLLDNGVVHAPAADLHELIGIARRGSFKRAVERVIDRPRREEIEMLIIGEQSLYCSLLRGFVLNGVMAVIQAIGAVRAAAYEQAGTEQGEEQQRLTAQLIFIHKHGDDECH